MLCCFTDFWLLGVAILENDLKAQWHNFEKVKGFVIVCRAEIYIFHFSKNLNFRVSDLYFSILGINYGLLE